MTHRNPGVGNRGVAANYYPRGAGIVIPRRGREAPAIISGQQSALGGVCTVATVCPGKRQRRQRRSSVQLPQVDSLAACRRDGCDLCLELILLAFPLPAHTCSKVRLQGVDCDTGVQVEAMPTPASLHAPGTSNQPEATINYILLSDGKSMPATRLGDFCLQKSACQHNRHR